MAIVSPGRTEFSHSLGTEQPGQLALRSVLSEERTFKLLNQSAPRYVSRNSYYGSYRELISTFLMFSLLTPKLTSKSVFS